MFIDEAARRLRGRLHLKKAPMGKRLRKRRRADLAHFIAL